MHRKTWNDAVDRWVLTTNHKRDHEKDLIKLKWLGNYLSGLLLTEISLDLIFTIGYEKKLETSPSTANRYLALLRAILRAARDYWGWIDHAPKVRLFKEPEPRVRWLKRAEAARLIKELPPHLSKMAAFTLSTGLRQHNVSYLRWSQIDLDRRLAIIPASESKNNRPITVPLNSDAMNILNSVSNDHDEYCFVYNRAPVDRTSTKAWAAAKKRANIQDFRWHDLRHTWASWHVQRGTSLQELQLLGGWKTFQMVLRYAHLSGDHLVAAAKRIETGDQLPLF
ncbi:tyrosine-type recombinase/integrase [Zhongshania marina]|uniref:Site-specific integrase n=1 Tax=Zhongshania marina TaxID=2304603 RepID=A0ABX9W7D4_9GAMM|nr:site-specific integrase [Zhongshania marina]